MADISQITIGGTTYNIKDTTARQSSGGGTAASTTYDNSDSDLQATNVQDAIDELDALIYDAGNYETVSLTIGSVDSTFSPVGQTITVTLEDGSSTDYVLTNSLVISFSVQKGIKYTISGTSTADYRVLPLSVKASIPTRYLTMRYIPIDTGVFILQKDGNYYLREEYDAETMAEDAVGVLVLTSALINAGFGLIVSKNILSASKTMANYKTSTSKTALDGFTNTINLINRNCPSGIYCNQQSVTVANNDIHGYIPSYAETSVVLANIIEVNLCLQLVTTNVLPADGNFTTSTWGSEWSGIQQFYKASNSKRNSDKTVIVIPFFQFPLS